MALQHADYIFVDFGFGGYRAAWCNRGDKTCYEVGNYPDAQADRPSSVCRVPTKVVYQPQDKGPAKPVAFGFTEPLEGQEWLSRVKTVLLPDAETYVDAYSILEEASKRLKLDSIQDIPGDFLKFAVQHTLKECGGQPTQGWFCSVPQSYGVSNIQNFRSLMQRAGAEGDIYIHGEGDCVAYAHLRLIERLVRPSNTDSESFSVAAVVLDLGAGTTVSMRGRMKEQTNIQ